MTATGEGHLMRVHYGHWGRAPDARALWPLGKGTCVHDSHWGLEHLMRVHYGHWGLEHLVPLSSSI